LTPAKRHIIAVQVSALALVSMLVYGVEARTADARAERLTARVESRYRGINDMSARFTQVRSGISGEMRSAGRVRLKRPSMMLWVYDAPQGDVIASDGRTLRLFQPDLNQVVERDLKVAPPSITTDLLSGVERMEEDFRIEYAGKESAGREMLRLFPRSPSQGMKTLTLTIDTRTSLVVATVMEDRFSNTTTLEFSEIRINTGLDDAVFRFKAPAGARVVRSPW